MTAREAPEPLTPTLSPQAGRGSDGEPLTPSLSPQTGRGNSEPSLSPQAGRGIEGEGSGGGGPPVSTPLAEHELPRNPRFLPVALVLWTGMFGAGMWVRPSLPAWSHATSMFLSASLLTGCSFVLLLGMARLALHRTSYLLVGALGLALVFSAARPLAQRTHDLDLAAGIPGEVLFLTLAQTAFFGLPNEGAVPVRNADYEAGFGFLEGLFPESGWRILGLCLSQLLLAGGLGLWIGNGIDEVGHLIPLALVATVADIWSVSAGATAIIVQSSQIHYFLLRFPLLGSEGPALPFLIGLTDFLFFGIFIQAAVRFRLGFWRNLALLASAFAIAIVSALFFKVGLPVLPFIGLLFLIGNRSNLSMKREDIRQLVLFLLAVGVAFLIFTVLAGNFHKE